jgi:hypothetical protein
VELEPLDLLRELRELKPTVVHFSGQGDRGGLWFQAPGGGARVVSPAAIAETFRAAGGSVKLVVLSACYSEPSAEALLAHVDCVVGMTGVLHDGMARAFAIGFYGALGDQESVAAASTGTPRSGSRVLAAGMFRALPKDKERDFAPQLLMLTREGGKPERGVHAALEGGIGTMATTLR